MQKLSKKILAEIKKQHLAPRSRLVFLAKNYGVWVLALLAVLLAAIFVSSLVGEVREAEWELASHFPGGRGNFLWHALPFFWLVSLLAACVFAYFLFRQTKSGYRFGLFAIVGSIGLVSLIGGVSLLATSLPPKFLDFRMHNFPPPFDEAEWQNPEEGFLLGEILQIGDKVLILNSRDQSVWEVGISQAKLPPLFELQVGMNIRAVGTQTSEKKFEADFIFPKLPHALLHQEMMREMHSEINSGD
ncbi:MAG: hypothetical protein V1936_02565 [Patescibacteria group bacterium]